VDSSLLSRLGAMSGTCVGKHRPEGTARRPPSKANNAFVILDGCLAAYSVSSVCISTMAIVQCSMRWFVKMEYEVSYVAMEREKSLISRSKMGFQAAISVSQNSRKETIRTKIDRKLTSFEEPVKAVAL
jgi:hypothetical protein